MKTLNVYRFNDSSMYMEHITKHADEFVKLSEEWWVDLDLEYLKRSEDSGLCYLDNTFKESRWVEAEVPPEIYKAYTLHKAYALLTA